MKTVILMLLGEDQEYRGEIEQPVEFVKAKNIEGDQYKIASIPVSSQITGYNLGDTVAANFDPTTGRLIFQKMLTKSEDKLLRTYDPLETKFVKQLKGCGCTIKNSMPSTIHAPANSYRDVEMLFDNYGYEFQIIA